MRRSIDLSSLDEASAEVELDGRRVALSNLDKILWPEARFTKRQMIGYYAAVAPVLLPHLRTRPLVLKRCPDGVDSLYWFQTQCPHPPAWMNTHPIPSASTDDKVFHYCVIDDLASLVWAANLGAVELHPLLARRHRLDEPTTMVFDLDPGAPATILDCCEVAMWLKKTLDAVGLTSLPKASGGKGLHVYVPLNTTHTYGQTKAFARTVARSLRDRSPGRVVDRPSRSLRRNKVLIDWSQNNAVRSMVAAYSLRALRAPLVSAPLTWAEVEEAVAAQDPMSLVFDAPALLERVDREGDLFAPVLQLRQRLPEQAAPDW